MLVLSFFYTSVFIVWLVSLLHRIEPQPSISLSLSLAHSDSFIHAFIFIRHRQQLIQQMQMIGAGQLGSQAANAIRHVAAQNGVWSLGNFGGIPPRSAMSSAAVGQPPSDGSMVQGQPQDEVGGAGAGTGGEASAKEQHLIKNIEDHDYRFVFNSCVIGMVSNT